MMRVERATSAERINAILNHPDVRPWIVSDDTKPLDLSMVVNDRAHYFLIGPRQTVLCFRIMLGIYEFHVAALPDGRGREMVEFAEAAETVMFTQTDAVELMTRIPLTHRASEGLAKIRGFTPRWERPSCLFRGQNVAYRVWSKTLQEWIEDYDIAEVVAAMSDAGQIVKATAWHNRWAALSREPLMRLDS